MQLKTKIKSFFNLVEIALAIAVAGIGLAGIMALFPVGLNSNRDAIGEAYAAESGEQLLSIIERVINSSEQQWFYYIQSNYSTNAGGFYLADEVLSSRNNVDSGEWFFFDPNQNPANNGIPTIESSAGFQDTDSDAPVFGADNIYQNIDSQYRPGLYRITQGTGNYVDFDAIARVWKSRIKIQYGLGAQEYDALDYGYTGEDCYGITLHTEISWPRKVPYNNRNKRYFVKEVFYSANY